ncbi:MAG: hypothetical protein KUG78_09030 [Kangiellaceae bacterium]|nr:hypothetical protein [Kangiellaceae bacterium]
MQNDIRQFVGKSLTQEKQVGELQTAAAFASSENEQFAKVLGTPFLIAEMERVCAKIIDPLLQQGQVSVGAHIDIRHLASTAVGARYEISATLLESRWGLFTFSVEAEDRAGIIAKGKIVRGVSFLDTIYERAAKSLS